MRQSSSRRENTELVYSILSVCVHEGEMAEVKGTKGAEEDLILHPHEFPIIDSLRSAQSNSVFYQRHKSVNIPD